MRPIFLKLLRVGVLVAGWMGRVWAFAERFLRIKKGEGTRRRAARFKALERRESEIERLDRLRNPGDYRGR